MPELTACRMCESGDLQAFLDLGHQPLSNAFLTREQLNEPEVTYPLVVVSCQKCGLAQLSYVVPKEAIFHNDYPYAADTTRTGREHFFGLAKTVVNTFALGGDDLAVDIGSNVGVLLDGFRAAGTRVCGIEPVNKLAEMARQQGLPTVTGFFDVATAKATRQAYGPAMAITGTNVFAHVSDLNAFTEAVKMLLLAPTGVFVIEVPAFHILVDELLFDTVYGEHLSYVSLTPTVSFFARHGLEVFDVELVPFHGGSLRIFVGYPGYHLVTPRVGEQLRLEAAKELHSMGTLRAFADRVRANRVAITRMLLDLKAEGKRIVAISAPAKGNTFLNYCKFDQTILDYATEKASLKIGLYTPGTHLPVVPEARLFEDKPSHGLLLSWNFREEVMQNLRAFSEAGGKFITALPEPKIT